jgi:hypothetical protein
MQRDNRQRLDYCPNFVAPRLGLSRRRPLRHLGRNARRRSPLPESLPRRRDTSSRLGATRRTWASPTRTREVRAQWAAPGSGLGHSVNRQWRRPEYTLIAKMTFPHECVFNLPMDEQAQDSRCRPWTPSGCRRNPAPRSRCEGQRTNRLGVASAITRYRWRVWRATDVQFGTTNPERSLADSAAPHHATRDNRRSLGGAPLRIGRLN